jgi:hypothetical protein
VYVGNSFPFVISSGTDAVLISENIQTAVGSLKNPVWQVYPNPADREISISAGGSFLNGESQILRLAVNSGINVKVYNIQGKMCLEKELFDLPHQIGLSMLPTGLYHLVIYSQDHVETHKFIKR